MLWPSGIPPPCHLGSCFQHPGSFLRHIVLPVPWLLPPQDSGLIPLRSTSSRETEAQSCPCVWAFASTGLKASRLSRLKLWFQSIPRTEGMASSVCTLKYSHYRESPPSLPKQACQVVFPHQKGQVRSHSPAEPHGASGSSQLLLETTQLQRASVKPDWNGALWYRDQDRQGAEGGPPFL